MSQHNPWYTSNDLIEAVKRKISMPVYQSTFNPQDILDFASEEMMISQVPSVLQYHEEYYVYKTEVPIVNGQVRYEIPERAIGMKLRDLFLKDASGHVRELIKVSTVNQSSETEFVKSYAYFIEGNEIVLVDEYPTVGTLVFSYFLRPSRLVLNERAAIISSFFRGVTLDHAQLLLSPTTLTLNSIVLTSTTNPVPGVNQFYIGTTSVEAATNLANLISSIEDMSASNGTPSSSTVSITTSDLKMTVVSSGIGMVVSNNIGLQMESVVPSNIAANTRIDFLQTRPGHRLKGMSVLLKSSNISTDAIVIPLSVVPKDMVAGDYIATENECIIPMLPTDLHTNLAERTCAAMLAAQGDIQGLGITNSRIAENKKGHDVMLNNRVDGSATRIVARSGFLRRNKGI